MASVKTGCQCFNCTVAYPCSELAYITQAVSTGIKGIFLTSIKQIQIAPILINMTRVISMSSTSSSYL